MCRHVHVYMGRSFNVQWAQYAVAIHLRDSLLLYCMSIMVTLTGSPAREILSEKKTAVHVTMYCLE